MLARSLATSSLLALLAATGCGNLVGDSPAGDASAPDSSAPGDAASPRASACPATLPQSGAACSPVYFPEAGAPYQEPQACEYGADPHCRTVATCGPPWGLLLPDPSCGGNPAGCPATFDAGVGGECPVQASCSYDQGRCACVTCAPSSVCGPRCTGPDGGPTDAGTMWQCASWLTYDGCPDPRPALGSPCTLEGQTCGNICNCSGIDLGPPGMECLGGFWNYPQGGC